MNLYWTLSRHYKELNQGEYSHIPFNENTEYFHECRNVLLDEFADFEGNEAPDIIDAVLNPRQTTIKEIRDLDQLLVETLEYLGMPVNIPTVEELLRPRGHLVENADSWRVWEIEKGEDHWLLTPEGLLECHGGGWLKNADGYILDPYGQKIGSNGIESGLALNKQFDDQYGIDIPVSFPGTGGWFMLWVTVEADMISSITMHIGYE